MNVDVESKLLQAADRFDGLVVALCAAQQLLMVAGYAMVQVELAEHPLCVLQTYSPYGLPLAACTASSPLNSLNAHVPGGHRPAQKRDKRPGQEPPGHHLDNPSMVACR